MAIIPITDKVLFWDPTNPINKIAMANANNSDTAYTMQDIINTVSYSGGSIDGSGTATFLPKFIDTNTIGDSIISDDGTDIKIPGFILHDEPATNTKFGFYSNDGFRVYTDGNIMIEADQASVLLKEAGAEKFRTTPTGISVTGGIVDSIGNLGNAGQYLSSTGTALRWLDVVGPTGMGAVSNNTGGNAVYGNIAVWNSATGMNYMPGTYSLTGDSLVIGSTNSGLAADCTGFGIDALRVATGGDNTAVGHRALYQVTGNDNTAMGEYAAISVTSGQDNVVIGASAAGSLNIGSDNTLIGQGVSGSIGEGMGNTAVGANSLGTLTGDEMLTRGQNNTCIGRFSGNLVDEGNNNTMIGYQSGSSVSDVNNEITLGNSSISSLRCQVTSITALSDQRDKKDIIDLSYGLDFVSSLKPREFIWDHRAEQVMDTMIPAEYDEDGKTIKKAVIKYKEEFSLRKGTKDIGFIAQELQTVDNEWVNLVNSNNPEKLEATYGHLIPVLVKAIQELSAKVEALES